MAIPDVQTKEHTTKMAQVRIKTTEPPPLHPGDRLTRAEFERRYHQHPEIKNAELVEGVVYTSSPVRHDLHSRPHAKIMTWLGQFWAVTPGTDLGDNGTVRLDFENAVQPDCFVRLEKDGKSQLAADGFIEGPPELVVEVVASSAAYDLHDKKRVYTRSGVREYLVFQMYEQWTNWFVLREGVYERLEADENGVIRSEVFPGLWLDTAAFWANDLAKILATLQTGLSTPEHAAFNSQLQEQ